MQLNLKKLNSIIWDRESMEFYIFYNATDLDWLMYMDLDR